MGPPEAPRAVSVGLRNCYLALPRRDKLFLLGFETAIWHVAAFDGLSLLCHGTSRGPTSCFRWASKLLSGTSEAPQAVSILGFETAIWHLFSTLKSLKTLKTLPAAFDGLSLLCHGSSRGPTSCFCWASKLLSDTSEAPQGVSIGLRNCYLARFQHPLKASKPSKPSQQLSTAFRCFAMGPPRRHKLFLLGVENAIWHVAAFDGHSLLCHASSRGPTSCFCWASKLLSGTSEVPQAVSIGLRNCYLARCSFRRPFAALPWVLPRPHKLLAVSIGLRNCYLARFQHPLKASKPSKPSQQLSTAFAALPWVLPRPHELFLLGFETAIWHFRSATRCFYLASQLLSGTLQLSTAFRCFAMGPSEAPQAVSVGLRNCYLALPKRHKLFLLGFETAIWHIFRTPLTFKGFKTIPAAFDGLSLLCHWVSKLLSGNPEVPQAVSIGLQNCYLARFQHP